MFAYRQCNCAWYTADAAAKAPAKVEPAVKILRTNVEIPLKPKGQ